MIICRPLGGLGNQLFQYASAYAIAKKNNQCVSIDDGFYRNYNLHGGYRLKNLLIEEEKVNIYDELNISRLSFFLVSKFKIFRYFFKGKLIFDDEYKDEDKYTASVALVGYWQRQKERVFRDYHADLKNMIKPVSISSRAIDYSIEIVGAKNSLAVHVRRGDYVNNPKALSFHGACSKNYYMEAISEVCKLVSPMSIFIFSDDQGWVEENILSSLDVDNFVAVSGCSPEEDLWLMSLSSHHVISNSTFSWWGAWLAKSNEQIVCSPYPWFADSSNDEIDPTISGWKRLPKSGVTHQLQMP